MCKVSSAYWLRITAIKPNRRTSTLANEKLVGAGMRRWFVVWIFCAGRLLKQQNKTNCKTAMRKVLLFFYAL